MRDSTYSLNNKSVVQSRVCNFPSRIAPLRTSSTGGFLRLQHPSRMHKVGIAQKEPWHNMGLNCIRIDLHICWVLDRLAPYKLPRAHVNLLFYQQPSSTIEYCSLPTGKLSGGRIHHRQPKTNQCPTSNQSPVVHYERQVWGWCDESISPPYKVLDSP